MEGTLLRSYCTDENTNSDSPYQFPPNPSHTTSEDNGCHTPATIFEDTLNRKETRPMCHNAVHIEKRGETRPVCHNAVHIVKRRETRPICHNAVRIEKRRKIRLMCHNAVHIENTKTFSPWALLQIRQRNTRHDIGNNRESRHERQIAQRMLGTTQALMVMMTVIRTFMVTMIKIRFKFCARPLCVTPVCRVSVPRLLEWFAG